MVLYNIPEGNKRESPTSYMTITNQRFPTAIAAEEAAAKAPASDSKPKAEKQAASSSSGSADAINSKIKEVGDSVRDLKAKKAPKVI